MPRDSQQDRDAVAWTTTSIPLGTAGLDLRTPNGNGSLVRLLNARFRDESTLDRRNGYRGVLIQDGSDFANGTNTPSSWLYGHGQLLQGLSDHYPIAGAARGTFRHDSTDVVWTGDRLLIPRSGDTAIGASPLWSRGGGSLEQGIPAYLPVQTDSAPPDVVNGDYVETCLTETLRVYVASTDDENLIAWVVDRETGAVIDRTELEDGTAIYEPRVINSGGIPVAVWLDATDLYLSWWSGARWSTPSHVAADCDSHNVAEVDGGFLLLWRTAGTVKVGRYLGHAADSSVFSFSTPLALGTTTGAMALALDPDEGFAVVYQVADQLFVTEFANDATEGDTTLVDATAVSRDSGLTACYRLLSDGAGYPLVIHAGNSDGVYTTITELAGDLSIGSEHTRYRTQVHSKSFRVGDEVFCWLRACNAQTAYLVASSGAPQVCGIADREQAGARVVNNDSCAIPMVYQDPLDEYAFTWARPFATTRIVDDARYAELYDRAGNAFVGDMHFLPKLSAVQFGESVYIAGSLVRNWDGIELGDAGFHDYPLIGGTGQSNGSGELELLGSYQFRVYPVRYNKRGERFQGPALTSSAIVLTGANDTIQLTINTVPCTNHADVTFEVYRTEAGGTTFYLDGVVANDLDSPTVAYTSTISDANIISRAADPHAPGIGAVAELEALGPVGCEVLVAMGDRLWGCGGQVPLGVVQFSKLKEPGEGAGFDPLAGTQQIDISGASVTSMATFGDAAIFFTTAGLQVITNAGPDNYGNGSFGVPQLVLSDAATTHWGTITTSIGVVFWGVDGPRLIGGNFSVDQICAPVRELSKSMTPSGVQVDLARQEVVWYSEDGTALLWNYRSVESKFGQLTSIGRWAQWSGLEVAGVSQAALATTDGRLLYEDEDANGDDGVPFEHAGASGNIVIGGILGGATHVRGIGVAGEFIGPHDLRVKVYYDGSPMWTEQWTWHPEEDTALQTGAELGDLTAAQLDALNLVDRSGQYATHKRVNRHDCRHFRIEWSDAGSFRPTYRLHELTLELGSKGGMGRVPVNTFGA